jgi:hypothetical protein
MLPNSREFWISKLIFEFLLVTVTYPEPLGVVVEEMNKLLP